MRAKSTGHQQSPRIEKSACFRAARARGRRNLVAAAFATSFVAGCANQAFEPKPSVTPIAPNTVVSSTGSLQHMVVLEKGTPLFFCSHPAPDETFAQTEGAQFSVPRGGSTESAQLVEASEENGLDGRSPGVLMTRELFFRACEFSRNYDLNKSEAAGVFNNILRVVAQGWNKEAANTAVQIGEVGGQDVTHHFSVFPPTGPVPPQEDDSSDDE